jgi:hypothetical protein
MPVVLVVSHWEDVVVVINIMIPNLVFASKAQIPTPAPLNLAKCI